MSKRITAKIGSYEKDGQTKGRYANLGVVLSNDNGEYMLLDPTVSLAGILALQNDMAMKDGKQTRDRVMVSIFTDDSGGQRQQGGGYGGQSYGGGAPAGGGGEPDFDEIPF